GSYTKVVGNDGMPEPAPKPKGPKCKFTDENDKLLIDLKEKKNLTWWQVADFFPGRTPETLQVRYCTKLKKHAWTDETVQKLLNAMGDYEKDRWKIIAAKVGCQYSQTECKSKAEEL
ncbi:putative transcriptional activator Myb, partial [Corynespora cassiicola Philippines]